MVAGPRRRIVDAMMGYDFIVVGAGSAGSAVAGRLATDPLPSVAWTAVCSFECLAKVRSALLNPPDRLAASIGDVSGHARDL